MNDAYVVVRTEAGQILTGFLLRSGGKFEINPLQ